MSVFNNRFMDGLRIRDVKTRARFIDEQCSQFQFVFMEECRIIAKAEHQNNGRLKKAFCYH